MITTQVRKGNEVLQAAFNVRMMSNIAKLQKVPFNELNAHLAGTREGSEGTEMEANICVIYCAIEEGFRLQKKPCPYTIDDVWDWMMQDESEFFAATDAVFKAIIQSFPSTSSGSDDGKK